MNQYEDNKPHARVHITSPGKRAGEPYDISVETFDGRELAQTELEGEAMAGVRLWQFTKQEMDKAIKDEGQRIVDEAFKTK